MTAESRTEQNEERSGSDAGGGPEPREVSCRFSCTCPQPREARELSRGKLVCANCESTVRMVCR